MEKLMSKLLHALLTTSAILTFGSMTTHTQADSKIDLGQQVAAAGGAAGAGGGATGGASGTAGGAAGTGCSENSGPSGASSLTDS